MESRPTISLIIPAYNEERGIRKVLSVAALHPFIAEVIVVDDGSSDRTREIVKEFPSVRLIQNEHNLGKTATIIRGIEESVGEFLFFLDADLNGLTSENITALLTPIRESRADVSLSLRNYYVWRLFGMDPLTGDRVLPRTMVMELLPHLRTIPSFALEVCINAHLIRIGATVAVVPWMNVYSPIKALKYGVLSGMKGEVSMWQDILGFIPARTLIRQFLTMRRIVKRIPSRMT